MCFCCWNMLKPQDLMEKLRRSHWSSRPPKFAWPQVTGSWPGASQVKLSRKHLLQYNITRYLIFKLTDLCLHLNLFIFMFYIRWIYSTHLISICISLSLSPSLSQAKPCLFVFLCLLMFVNIMICLHLLFLCIFNHM